MLTNIEARHVGKGRRTNETPGTIGGCPGLAFWEIPVVQGGFFYLVAPTPETPSGRM